MSLLDRILLRAFSLVVAVSAIWLGLWLFGVASVVQATHAAVVVGGAWNWIYVVVVLLAGLRFLLFRLQARPTHSFVKDTEGGEVRITHTTVNELARRAAKQVRGVDRLHTQVDETAEGLVISVRVRAIPGVDLTSMSEQVQRNVAEAVRGATSLKVGAVHVQVSDLTPEPAQR